MSTDSRSEKIMTPNLLREYVDYISDIIDNIIWIGYEYDAIWRYYTTFVLLLRFHCNLDSRNGAWLNDRNGAKDRQETSVVGNKISEKFREIMMTNTQQKVRTCECQNEIIN